MKASLTLEGTFIYPIIIGVTCILIIQCFNLHDRLSCKATTYTHLVKQYLSDDTSSDLSSLTDDLSEVCLLHYAIGATNKNDDAVIVKHKLGDFIVSFSHYERTLTYGP